MRADATMSPRLRRSLTAVTLRRKEVEMDRRRFLSTTILSGIAAAGFAGTAHAFTESKCAPGAADLACRELIRHHELLAQLQATLEQRGLNEEQRKAILASAVCPFCGQPLVG